MGDVNIGTALMYLRGRKNLSQERLAEMADISRTQLSNIENDKINPSLKTVIQLAAALEVSIDFLVYFGGHNALPSNIYDECSPWERSVINDIALATRDVLKRHPYDNCDK